jgi:hypothetical protein
MGRYRSSRLTSVNCKGEIMRIQSVLLASLLLGLYGCQQQTSAPQQAEPVVELPASASAVLQAAASGPVASASAVEPVTAVSEVKVAEPVKPATPAKVEAVAAKAAPVVKVRTEKVVEKLPVSAKAVVEPVQAAPAVVAPARKSTAPSAWRSFGWLAPCNSARPTSGNSARVLCAPTRRFGI